MKPLAVIVDRDGTLASLHNAPNDRSKDSWAAYNAAMVFDAPVPEIVALLHAIRPDVVKIMVSGRMEGDWPGDRRRRFQMIDWIAKHGISIDHLYMRSGGDTRKDSDVKRDIMVTEILPYYRPVVAIDDREVICKLWEEFGLYVIRVTNPGMLPPIAFQMD